MADLSIKLSKIDSGRSLFKVSMRLHYPDKIALETIIEAISNTIEDLNSKKLKLPRSNSKSPK